LDTFEAVAALAGTAVLAITRAVRVDAGEGSGDLHCFKFTTPGPTPRPCIIGTGAREAASATASDSANLKSPSASESLEPEAVTHPPSGSSAGE
jgi:hypothetical protein